MSNVEFRMYETLRKHWSDEDANDFIESLDERVAAKFEIMKQDLATKDDINLLKSDIRLLDSKIDTVKVDFNKLRGEFAELRVEFANLRTELKSEISGFRAEIAKSINSQSLLQLVAIIGAVVSIVVAMKI